MPIFEASVNLGGIERIRNGLAAIKLTDKDKAGPLKREMQDVHVRQVNRAFKTKGGSVLGGAWPGWSPRTFEWRKRHRGMGRTMMQLNKSWGGREPKQLRRAFTLPGSPRFIGKFKKPFTYQFGAADSVAARHEAGAGRLPRRSVIAKTLKDIQDFAKQLQSFMNARIDQVVRNL